MVKLSALFFLVFISMLFIGGCSSPAYCTTPNILIDGNCCPDHDGNGVCDDPDTVPQQKQPIPPVLTTPSLHQTKEPAPVQQQPIISTVRANKGPFLGKATAETTLVVFGDYSDKNTARLNHDIVPQLLHRYSAHVIYTFRPYFLPTDKRAQQAAQASMCAEDQNLFWEYHNVLLNNTYNLAQSQLITYAQDLQLDVAAFTHCLTTNKHLDELITQRDEATDYGITRTPVVFVNNQKLVGYKPLTVYEETLAAELYDILKEQESTVISAKSIGKSYRILEGPAVFDEEIPLSPYSNVIDFSDATFKLTSQDATATDSPTSQDTAQLTTVFTLPSQVKFQTTTYTIKLTRLVPEGTDYPFFGGVATNTLMHGSTGIGSTLLPASQVPLSLWGFSDLYADDKLIGKDLFTHFMITVGIRDENNHLTRQLNKNTLQAHLLVSDPQQISQIPGIQEPFLHFFWNKLDFRES